MKTLEEKIAVMQHVANGGMVWVTSLENFTLEPSLYPSFNWECFDYNIYEKHKTKPSLDWSHVNKEFKWLARDECGRCFIYVNKPEISSDSSGVWYTKYVAEEYIEANVFSSLDTGTCDWKDSLVERPEGV